MLLATALALFITGCAQQTFTVQNKPAAVAPKENHHPSFLRFWNWAAETVGRCQFVAAQKIIKARNPANIRKWIARFYYFRHLYSAGSACIAHNNCMSCPSIWATLSALLINILLGSFQLFLHSDQPLSEGEIILFSGVCQSGEAALSTPEVVASRTDRQTALMCNRRRPAATSSRRWSFSALASANSFVYFIERSNITLTHLHVSNCRVRQLSFWAFCRAGLCR